MRKFQLLFLALLISVSSAWAVPETVSVRVADVTTSSFAVVWMTSPGVQPQIELYGDAALNDKLSDGLMFTPLPDMSTATAEAARQKGIMQVRVSGLQAGTTYHVRTVSVDPGNPDSIGYSAPYEVQTATEVKPFRRAADNTLDETANDLLTFNVYIRPGDVSERPGLGDLLLLETPGGNYPLSAFVGTGTVEPEGVVDLNNLFGVDGVSLAIAGGEAAQLRVYRGDTLSTLLHYRRFPTMSGTTTTTVSERGFYADVNLDGRVDAEDFAAFRDQYRQDADDAGFNPDFNFIAVETGGEVRNTDKIDAQDFARFATQYGRTDVE